MPAKIRTNWCDGGSVARCEQPWLQSTAFRLWRLLEKKQRKNLKTEGETVVPRKMVRIKDCSENSLFLIFYYLRDQDSYITQTTRNEVELPKCPIITPQVLQTSGSNGQRAVPVGPSNESSLSAHTRAVPCPTCSLCHVVLCRFILLFS